jgi:hypothetical protein
MTNEKPWRIADLLADLTFVPFGNGMERATIPGESGDRNRAVWTVMRTSWKLPAFGGSPPCQRAPSDRL